MSSFAVVPNIQTWLPVNLYLSQFVLKSTRSQFGHFVLMVLVNSYSVGQFVLIIRSFRVQFGQPFWLPRNHFDLVFLKIFEFFPTSDLLKTIKLIFN